jgi:hypothetical protein
MFIRDQIEENGLKQGGAIYTGDKLSFSFFTSKCSVECPIKHNPAPYSKGAVASSHKGE